MLALSRKKGQSIVIGDNIEITIVDIQGDQVRLGINAPKNVKIHRKEIFEEIVKENKEAAQVSINSLDTIKGISIKAKDNEKK